jgi:hypothetical protein
MGTFTTRLNAYILVEASQRVKLQRQVEVQEVELKQMISKLEIGKAEKLVLEKQIVKLRESSEQKILPPSISAR